MPDKRYEAEISVHKGVLEPAEHSDAQRILLVDDEQCILTTVSCIFEGMGYDTDVAGNGFEALNMFLRKPFDLVVTDLNMKGMDGLSLINKIKQRSPLTPVILLTGEEPVTVKKKAKNSKVDLILFKPFKIEDIENAVLGVLDKKGSHGNIIYQ